MQKEFPVTSVCKEDIIKIFQETSILEQVKKRVEEMKDSEMKELASQMADDYCEQLFWSSLKIIFEDRFL